MVIKFQDDNFDNEVLNSSLPVIVDFYADWCKPCQLLSSVIEEISNDYQGSLKVGKVNVEESRAIAAMYGIRSLPTIAFFRNGDVVEKVIGAVQKQLLDEKINQFLL